ncbi:MAG: adenylosuccinate synthase [Chloroflexota bacterium]|nr:MAG: adenylosuccinate synthase [Chloroflexota bacterium]
MTFNIIVGAQWGDEGKGRVVDLLASEADYVARYSGGDNAGHTVTVGEQTFKLHLIPSGVIHPHTIGVLGNGMVINPAVLLAEMEQIRGAGVNINPQRMRISYAAHVITPGHIALDKAREMARGAGKIGTTQRGIGPAYNDKAARSGIRMESVLSPETFADEIMAHIEKINQQLTSLYGAPPLDAQSVAQEYVGYARILAPYVGDITTLLSTALKNGKYVLAEGAQGTLLDLDHGTYPFVTSSTPTAPGALVGLGLGVGRTNRVVGVTKAFQTRVGEGPFPTEVFGEAATRLRGTGTNPWDEFGTTTGRPRRVGWLDAVLLRYAVQINGLTELTLTKLDILTGLNTLRICTGYKTDGKTLENLPLGPKDLTPFEPVYEELPGWEKDVWEVRKWADLPAQAQAYIQRIETLVDVPVSLVSVGPERDQIIRR